MILYSLALCIALIPPTSGSNRQQADQERLRIYRETLQNFGVAHDAQGAHEFLNSLFPKDDSRSEIDELIKGFASPTYLQRETAEKKLIARGPEALDQLQVAAKEGDTETRSRSKRCLMAIELIHDQLVFAAIQVVRLDPEEQPSRLARLDTLVRLLRKFKQHKRLLLEAPQGLVDASCQKKIQELLNDQDEDVRIAAVFALPHCHTDSELSQFVGLIEDENPRIALAAIETIGYLAPLESSERLIENLSHLDEQTRRTSATLLRTISGKYFQFRADASHSNRRRAIKKWKSWVSNHALGAEHFKRLEMAESAPPTGFLVSVSNSQVHQFDLNGNELWNHRVALYDAQYINENEIIVAERNRDLVRIINRAGETQLRIENVESPSDVEMLPNGNVLVLSGTGKLYEFSNGKLIKTYTGLDNPFDADRLPDGDTIVADSGNNRLVIYDPQGQKTWEKTQLQFPNNVHRLPDGRIVYTTYTSGDVVMLDSQGSELWRRNLPGATLYSVYATANEVYVADGSNSKIWILGPDGSPNREIKIPVRFCDVDFITR